MTASMNDYIHSQDINLKDVIAHMPGEMDKVDPSFTNRFKRIYFIGSGTSINACLPAKYLLDKYMDCETQVLRPFEFLHYFPDSKLGPSSLIIGVSQTARSTGVLEAILRAKKTGSKTIFVTANPTAPYCQEADLVLDTWTGIENVGPKTKGFTSTMATLFYLAARLAGEEIDLSGIPEFISQVLAVSDAVMPNCVDLFKDASSFTIIGYGPNMAAALEGGLKLLETVRVPVEVYDVEEYMHGPYHCLEPDKHLIFLAPNGPGFSRIAQLINFTSTISTYTVIITDNKDELPKNPGIVIPLPGGTKEVFCPLGFVIPIQILSYQLTKLIGRNPELSRYPDFHKILGSKKLPAINK